MMDMYALLMGGSGGGGGGDSSVVVGHIDPDTYTTDLTWQQVYDYIKAGKIVVFPYESSENNVRLNCVDGASYSEDNGYLVSTNGIALFADSADDYLFSD